MLAPLATHQAQNKTSSTDYNEYAGVWLALVVWYGLVPGEGTVGVTDPDRNQINVMVVCVCVGGWGGGLPAPTLPGNTWSRLLT